MVVSNRTMRNSTCNNTSSTNMRSTFGKVPLYQLLRETAIASIAHEQQDPVQDPNHDANVQTMRDQALRLLEFALEQAPQGIPENIPESTTNGNCVEQEANNDIN